MDSIEAVHCQQGFSWLLGCVALFSLNSVGTLNVQLFQDQQAHHQANEIGWPALALGVMFGKGAVQFEHRG
jgi:hypothetical protein